MKLHENSLTIPRTELAAFLGSKTMANECADDLVPVRKQTSCVVYDRDEVKHWYFATQLAKRTPRAYGKDQGK